MTDTRPELLRGVVHPWHHDHIGHMNVRWYGHFFDDAAFHVWPAIGVAMRDVEQTHGVLAVTAQATTNFLKELKGGDLIRIDGAVIRLGTKSVTFQLRMMHVETGELHATYDMVEVFFNTAERSSAPIPAPVRTILARHLVSTP